MTEAAAQTTVQVRCDGYNHHTHPVSVDAIPALRLVFHDHHGQRPMVLCPWCLDDWALDHPDTCIGCGCTSQFGCVVRCHWIEGRYVCSNCLARVTVLNLTRYQEMTHTDCRVCPSCYAAASCLGEKECETCHGVGAVHIKGNG